MTGAELISEVQHIIQDPSYEDDRILVYLNEGLNAVASRVDIPGLEQIDTVITSTSGDSVSLPVDYMRDVKYVNSVTNEVLISASGRATEYLKFRRRNPFPTSGERVTDVGVRKSTLYYYPIPNAAETLQLAYFKTPETLVTGGSPDILPAHLQRRVLCSYAAWVVYSQVEDGVEGPQVNTARQWQNYLDAVSELVDYIGDTDSEPVYIADDYNVEVQ